MERLLEFLNKWISPFTITAVLGFVIWLVQIESRTLEHQGRIAEFENDIQHMERNDQSTALLLSRTAAVQESLIHQLDALERRMTRNEGNITDNAHRHGE